jgi:hypothetical protein
VHVLSFTPNDREIATDADLRFLSGFILEQFPAENKIIEEEMRKTGIERAINAAMDPSHCTSTISHCPLFISAPLL